MNRRLDLCVLASLLVLVELADIVSVVLFGCRAKRTATCRTALGVQAAFQQAYRRKTEKSWRPDLIDAFMQRSTLGCSSLMVPAKSLMIVGFEMRGR